MRFYIKIFITSLLAVITTLLAFGEAPSDSVKVYFNVGHREFDPSIGDNRKMMDGFIEKVREAAATDDIERIVVRGYASPDGFVKANERLARYRCASIADFLASHAGISSNLIEQVPEGIGWDELRHLVAVTPDVPSRQEVLDIIDNTPVWIFNAEGKVVSGRKKELMDLHGGKPYNWLLTHLFPLIRNGVGVMLYVKDKPDMAIATTDKSDASDDDVSPDVSDTSELSEITDEPEVPEEAVAPAIADEVIEYDYHRAHFALKNNLLYDAALMPNLEFEWLINNHWSVSVEGDVAWWKPREYKVYRLAIVSPEVRYHFNSRDLWRGIYVGAFVGGGLYQLENGGDGYRGEGGMGGMSFGYMLPLGKHFFMEAALGAGYMQTRYKVYEPRDGHRLYMRTKSLDYFGPLKLKLSIAWRFDIVTKTKKVNSPL